MGTICLVIIAPTAHRPPDLIPFSVVSRSSAIGLTMTRARHLFVHFQKKRFFLCVLILNGLQRFFAIFALFRANYPFSFLYNTLYFNFLQLKRFFL